MADAEAPPLASRLGGGFTRLLLWPIIRPTWTDGGPSAIRAESGRRRRLHETGLLSPVVLAMLAAQTLGRLHRAGLCHGRPIFEAIVFDGEQVIFPDASEDPGEVTPLATAQARDVVLFFVSTAVAFRGPDVRERLDQIWRAYLATEPTPELRRALRRSHRRLRCLTLPPWVIPRRWVGRDLVQALWVLRRRWS